MAQRVRWTETAWNDLKNIADFIAQDSPYYAAALVREIRDAARSLKRFAERGRIVPEFDSPNIRELFIRHYRLIYDLQTEEVRILALIHGARDLSALIRKSAKA